MAPRFCHSAPGGSRTGRRRDVTADETDLAAAIEVIPNPDLGWHDWNRIGMALWRGTSGSEGGRAMWHKFSEKSEKYDARTTDEKWQEYFTSPPDQIGAGTIFWEADQASPGWRFQFDLRIEAELRDAGLCEIIEAGSDGRTSDAEPQVAVRDDEATVVRGIREAIADVTDDAPDDCDTSQDPPQAEQQSSPNPEQASELVIKLKMPLLFAHATGSPGTGPGPMEAPM